MKSLEFTGRLPLCLDADITSECWNFTVWPLSTPIRSWTFVSLTG